MMTDPIVRIDDGVDEGPLERLSRFRDALNTSLSQYPSVAIDLSEVRDPDVRFVQIIEAARIHAAGTGADIALAGPIDAGFARLLERAGFMTGAHPFWSQGATIQ